ncbi:uncharacterized protein LOC118203731 [Stegodyphus dumicola]|uniref:uncharacterized protein LOC118203731 n=1 Tax=Stegodyphus dumicola TaxID=202533 RepID=UPI0015B109FE|nr:uncharacterized protein LOC118203731 [Stegodyphus dumicola]
MFKQEKKLFDVYGEKIYLQNASDQTVLKNFDFEDAPCSGKPVEADEDTIKAIIDAKRLIKTPEIAERSNLSNSIVHDHLKSLGLISKLDICVPHVSVSSQWTRNGLSATMLNARHHGAKKTNRLKALRKPIFIKKDDTTRLVGFQRNLF